MEAWYGYILAGLAAGVLSSLFGVGSGILVVPILTLAFGFGQKNAQGMALAIMVPMALVGALRYFFNPAIGMNLKAVAWLALGGVIGALIGSQVVFGISESLLKRLFAVFIIITGIHLFIKSYSTNSARGPHAEHQAQ